MRKLLKCIMGLAAALTVCLTIHGTVFAATLLSMGATGSEVVVLQNELTAAGYSPGRADGVFGQNTLAALEAFQVAHGLVADGIVGEQTRQALDPTRSAQGPGGSDGSGDGFINLWNHEPARVDGGKNVVLTFDDGPSPWTATLIQTLDDANVPAIFFWNTYHIRFANQDVQALLNDSPNIQVGDHTVDHPNLLHLGYGAQDKEIVDAQSVIADRVGQPVVFFRPPYGNYNAATEQILHKAGMVGVMWDDDSLDWKYGSNEAAILHQIRSELKPGAIILMHDHADTIRFLPDIIAMIQKLGYGFTTLVSPQPSSALTTDVPTMVLPRDCGCWVI